MILAERDQLDVVRCSRSAFKQSFFYAEWTGNYSLLSSAEQIDTSYTKSCIVLVLEEKDPSLRECGDGESELDLRSRVMARSAVDGSSRTGENCICL